MRAAAFSSPISWTMLIRRTIRETVDDDCLGIAAQLAFYFFLALFPAVLFLLALASFFPLQNLVDDLTQLIGPFVSSDVLGILQEQMHRLGESDNGGILTFGVAGAIWSSSAALVSIASGLNQAYDVHETRPWWKVRLIALGLTIVLAVLVVASTSLVLAGPSLATYLGRTVGLGWAFEWTWKLAQWPIALGLITFGFSLTFYFAPDIRQRWTWLSPGALLATLLWLVSSLGLKLYVQKVTDYDAAYGAIGAVIVLLLWFYVSGFALLVGAEMNSEIVHAWEEQGRRDDAQRTARQP